MVNRKSCKFCNEPINIKHHPIMDELVREIEDPSMNEVSGVIDWKCVKCGVIIKINITVSGEDPEYDSDDSSFNGYLLGRLYDFYVL